MKASAPRPATKAPLAASCSGLKSSFCLSIMSGAAKFMATVAPRTALLGADSFDARIWAVAWPAMARPNLQSGEGIFDCYFSGPFGYAWGRSEM